MPESREWARELTQSQFEREWLQRNPFSDIIPNREVWVDMAEPVYLGITGVNAGDLELESLEPAKHLREAELENEVEVTVDEEAQLKWKCDGCGKAYKYAIAKYAHERRCKVLLAKKL